MPLELDYSPFGFWPAPFVTITVTGIDAANPCDESAQVDTGADRTLVPTRVVERLGLPEVERITFEVADGHVVVLPIFLLLVTIPGFDPVEVYAAASDGESHILLGRDVLNYYRVILDGPAELLRFE